MNSFPLQRTARFTYRLSTFILYLLLLHLTTLHPTHYLTPLPPPSYPIPHDIDIIPIRMPCHMDQNLKDVFAAGGREDLEVGKIR